MSEEPEIHVVAACIVADNRVLLTQRTPDRDFPYLWECPGGKVEPGEAPVLALARELREELDFRAGFIAAEPFFEHRFEAGEIESPIRRAVRLSFYAARPPRRNAAFVEVDPFALQHREMLGAGWFSLDEMETFDVNHLLIPGNVKLNEELHRRRAGHGPFFDIGKAIGVPR